MPSLTRPNKLSRYSHEKVHRTKEVAASMIIRQFCARHGRTVLAQSSRSVIRAYATDISVDNPMLRPSERDPKPTSQVPRHLDDPFSILDTANPPPSSASRSIAEQLESQEQSIRSLQADINAHVAARIMSIGEPPQMSRSSDSKSSESKTESTLDSPSRRDPLPFAHLKELNRFRRFTQKESRKGTHLSQTYDPTNILRHPPNADDLTLPMLLAHQTHLGHATSLWNPANSGYIFGVRDGIHIISLDVTYAYLKRAAKVVQEVAKRGGIILFVGTRDNMEEVTVNSAKLGGGYHIFHRWVPGSLTNGQQILGSCAVKVVDIHDRELPEYRGVLSQGHHRVMRPDLVVCLNPLENKVCLHECGLFNVPTIGVIDTDANPTWVTYPIPANDDSFRSVALIGGVLGQAAKEGQTQRMQAAARGNATYRTDPVYEELEFASQLSQMDVQEADNSKE
ncbi:ribosomal protein S2 [Rhinocladiella mackenziei CBS 650.93]|uniref:Ribosomal protein S2 n=1 Tax=Rhinocladiella mackenziei CBS 650.93 TaxID=1442369 RepID=A0A0D2IN18_9EURO|nr:ribosomal protein S2 [Rhinocladiella mackenziei CBS 650.93]KIX07214.1 ribosomal protein S2 [Rhinocladiella mackenziei CBS 650.93]